MKLPRYCTIHKIRTTSTKKKREKKKERGKKKKKKKLKIMKTLNKIFE